MAIDADDATYMESMRRFTAKAGKRSSCLVGFLLCMTRKTKKPSVC